MLVVKTTRSMQVSRVLEFTMYLKVAEVGFTLPREIRLFGCYLFVGLTSQQHCLRSDNTNGFDRKVSWINSNSNRKNGKPVIFLYSLWAQ